MIELTVSVPEDEAVAIADQIRRLDPKVKIKPHPVLVQAELAEYLQTFKERIQAFGTPRAEDDRPDITAAFNIMFASAFRWTSYQQVTTEQLARLRATFMDIFLDCTRKKPVSIGDGNVTRIRWQNPIIAPRCVVALLERYSLETDGKIQPYTHVAKILDVKRGEHAATLARAAEKSFCHPLYLPRIVYAQRTDAPTPYYMI